LISSKIGALVVHPYKLQLKILKIYMNLTKINMNQNIFYIYALYKNQSINQTENLNKNENENIE